MATYVFSGIVRPAHALVYVQLPPFEFVVPSAELKGRARFSILGSHIHVEVDTDGSDLLTLRNCVTAAVQTSVDALGFLHGAGYQAEIDAALLPDGTQHTFLSDIAGLAKPDDPSMDFVALCRMAGAHPYLGRALADIREAIRRPSETMLFSYRAIEDVRQAFVNIEDSSKRGRQQSWADLKRSLRVERSAQLEQIAQEQRHGEARHLSGAERIAAMTYARAVVRRYCEYLHGQNAPLPSTLETVRYVSAGET